MGRLHSTAKRATASAGVIAPAALAACDGSSVIGGGGGGPPSTGQGVLAKVDKVDILVSVDNSRSMADKQTVLSLALSDLVQSLTNPPCVMSNSACDCSNPANDSPLCDPSNKTTQVRAKAYPGQRELSLLKSVGPQGVVASICPSQVDDPTRVDYAYRPAVAALIGRVKGRLKL